MISIDVNVDSNKIRINWKGMMMMRCDKGQIFLKKKTGETCTSKGIMMMMRSYMTFESKNK
jgi:nitrous oxidase accessory protein NosD